MPRQKAPKTSTEPTMLEQIHTQLAEDALKLAQAIEISIEGAPLNQLATALSAVVDRYLKVDEILAAASWQQKEQVIRIEYTYPDGTIHQTPPWAEDDFEFPGTVQNSGVRTPLREDGDGENYHYRNGAARQNLLVDVPYADDVKPGVARFEDDLSDFTRIDD